MRTFGIIFFSILTISACKKNPVVSSSCSYEATAIDQTGLDGCGFLFQISENERVEPVQWAIPQPELKNGRKYLIDYEPIQFATICMAGKTVRITCISSMD